jgi:hypothetical protein
MGREESQSRLKVSRFHVRLTPEKKQRGKIPLTDSEPMSVRNKETMSLKEELTIKLYNTLVSFVVLLEGIFT